MSGTADSYTYRAAEMGRLAGLLSGFLDLPVVDDTGLKGLYDFSVKKPEDLRQNGPAKNEGGGVEASTAGVFADVLKPLGLQLVLGRVPIDYLVVDSVGRLKEN
jgi:uncharacterized protein (TIGR03435 family)